MLNARVKKYLTCKLRVTTRDESKLWGILESRKQLFELFLRDKMSFTIFFLEDQKVAFGEIACLSNIFNLIFDAMPREVDSNRVLIQTVQKFLQS